MMNPELNHPVILALGWMLIHSLWQATLIGLLIRGLWLFISRKYASWRYGLALTGLLLTLIVASISFVYYLGQYSHAARLPDSIAETYHEGPLSVIDAVDIMPAAPENTMAGTPVDFELIDPVFSWEHYLPYLVLLWGLGAWIMGLRLVGSWWYMRRVSRQGIAHPDTFWAKRFAGMCRRMGLNRRVQLYFSRLVDEPLTFGHLKPVILFPLGLVNQLSVEQVEAILLHELAHIRRWDYLVNWLQSVLELLFFFHPAVWWLSGEVRKAREHCCDDMVLKKGQTSRKLYAQTLTQIAALSFTPKTKLVMSIQGIKDAFSQRVLRLYGQHQAVLDWRKPVLSLALGCMLLPVLWLTQPALFTDVPTVAENKELTTYGEEDNVLDSDSFLPQSSPIITAPVEIPFTESAIELPEDQFYDQLSLEALIDPRRMVPWEVPATIPVLDPTEQQDRLSSSGAIAPQVVVSNEPTFIVDGRQIPDGAPYRQIGRDDIEKFIWRHVPWSPELTQRIPPENRNGVIEIITKEGNWPGGRPYWPQLIRSRERYEGEHMTSWFPLGKANSRKELGGAEGTAFLPGANRALRKINGSGQESHAILNGRVLQKGEVVEVNRHEMFGSRWLPAIGLYDGLGQLIYGVTTPPEIADRTMKLKLKDGYHAIIGKYPCDNRIYLRSYTNVNQFPIDYNFYEQLNRGFADVPARKALRYCRRLETSDNPPNAYRPVVPEPLFIIDGQVIHPAEPYREIPNDQLTTEAFLLPAEAVARYGADARNGAVILTSKAGAEAWKEGKPYSPLYKLLGGDRQTGQIENYIDCDHYFIDGQPVSMDDFNHFNIFSFVPGSITSTNVATVYGLDKKSVNLSQLQEQVKDRGIAYELGSGVVVVKYLEDCRNPIKMARIHSPLTAHLGQEERRLKEMISFRERSIPCDEDLEQENTPFDQQDVLEMIDKNLQFVSLQQKLKNSLNIYPSPFTREVKIAFTLSETAYTKVIILGAEGKLITQLVDKKLNGGQHEFSWDAGNQSPGNYWVRIEAGEATLVRPLLKQ